MKHTPTPWIVVGTDRDTHIIATTVKMKRESYEIEEDAQAVVSSSEWTIVKDEDAEFIVRACNSHEELISGIKYAIAHFRSVTTDKYNPFILKEQIFHLEKILEKAELTAGEEKE